MKATEPETFRSKVTEVSTSILETKVPGSFLSASSPSLILDQLGPPAITEYQLDGNINIKTQHLEDKRRCSKLTSIMAKHQIQPS